MLSLVMERGCALDPEAQWCVWRDLLFSLHDIGITEVRALLLPAALDAVACIQNNRPCPA